MSTVLATWARVCSKWETMGFFIDGYTGPGGEIAFRTFPGSYCSGGCSGHNIAAPYTFCSEGGDVTYSIETIPHLSAGEHWTCDIYIKRESFPLTSPRPTREKSIP